MRQSMHSMVDHAASIQIIFPQQHESDQFSQAEGIQIHVLGFVCMYVHVIRTLISLGGWCEILPPCEIERCISISLLLAQKLFS